MRPFGWVVLGVPEEMIVGLHHVAISVPDIDQALGFYCGVLGLEQVQEADIAENSKTDATIGLKNIRTSMRMLRIGNAFIELWEYRHPQPLSKDPLYPPSDHGISHFCIQVSDINSEYNRLKENGMTFVGPPVDYGILSAVYGRDPFGNILEIYEPFSQAAAQLE